MAIRPLRLAPDPVLLQKAKPVKKMDESIEKLINDMIETMPAVSGVGLAAPQIGVSLQVAVIGMPDEEPIVLINPEIVKASGERIVTEGCLSVPGYVGEVRRSVTLTVKGRDRNWRKIRIKATELLAQAIEHEIDHLNGALYVDRLESPDKLYQIETEEERGL